MRRSIARGVAAGVVVLLLVGALGARLDLWTLEVPRPEGTWAWTLSRAASVSAYLALTLDVLFGLFLSTAAADRWIARARSVEIHRFLSLAAIGLTAAHAIAMLGDRYVPFDLLDVTVPFLAGYRRVGVGMGIVAMWLAVLVHASFALRARIGPRVWRAVHYLAFVVFALATLHGVTAGTDTRATWMQLLYGAAGASVAGLTLVRVALALAPRPRLAR
nr:ferric reductase-like transmembrane domain-containing protein [Deltaproteobacteria bacterium]